MHLNRLYTRHGKQMEIKKKLRKKIICVETGDLDNMLEVSYDIELLAS